MNSLPRRSARISQLHQQQSSSTSPSASSLSSSVSTSSYPSPADSLPQQQDSFQLQLQSQFLAAPQRFDAPLPSPSANETDSFFGYTHVAQGPYQMPQQSQQTAQQSTQQYSRTGVDKCQPQHVAEHHNSFSSQQRQNVQTANKGGQLPPDFLAEAARRAQMACLMRDLGDVTL